MLPGVQGRIERRGIAVQLADRIESEIRTSVWTGRLPGKRTLAGRYGFNVKTVAAAIALLEQRGFLEPARAGRGRAIQLPRPGGRLHGGAAEQRLLVIHPSGGCVNLGDLELVRAMAERWEKLQGEVAWAGVDFPRCKSPGPLLDALIQRHSPDALLMLSAGEGWHRAAAERLPFYMAGGQFEPDLPVSLGAGSIGRELALVVKHLRGLGHRRILVPGDGGCDQIRRSVLDGLRAEAAGKPDTGTWEDYCPRFTEHVPEAWSGYWKKAFARLKPTAVVVFEDTALLSLYGHCHAAGLRIPQDLSVVLMSHDPRFGWLLPRPVMMRYAAKPAVAHFQRWVKGGLRPLGRKFFPLEMIAGSSVAPPAGGSRS